MDRRSANHKGFVVWFTGLSGSGKSTIARRVADEIALRRDRVELLSGSGFRRNISSGLGYSREDRIANVRRIGYVAKLLARNDVAVVTTSISPYRSVRDECRQAIGEGFIEVFVDCPVAICEQRDPKGLYAKARSGEIDDFTGINDPYEPPLDPEVTCQTAFETPEESAVRVIAYLDGAGWIPEPADALAEEALVRERLRGLGTA
ncbi:MAG: adenylyl-sulfate kinase [Longimicrobiales bacterium]